MNIYAVLIESVWTLGTYAECFELAKRSPKGATVFKLTEVANYQKKKEFK